MNFPPPSERQARLIWAALTGLAVATLAALVVALVWGLGRVLGILSPVLWPLAIAGVIAYLLDPVVDFLERRRVPRTRAILSVFALALVLAIGLVGSVVPQLVVETRDLARRVPDYATRLEQRVERWINHPPDVLRRFLRPASEPVVASPSVPVAAETNAVASAVPEASATPTLTNLPPPAATATNLFDLARSWGVELDPKLFTSATGWFTGFVRKAATWFFGQVARVASWFGVLIGLFLVPIYAFYFLLEKRGIQSRWTEYLPLAKSELRDELAFVLQSINDYLIAFFRGQVVVAMCDGVLYAIGFSLIGLPYAVLIGAMAMVLTLIPYIGAAITCATALVLALVTYGDWLHPLLALGVYALVQLIEGFVIQPKIMGDRVGLHPLTIIIAMMVGTTLLGGLLGAILAIPFTAALRVVMFRYVWRGRERPAGGKPAA